VSSVIVVCRPYLLSSHVSINLHYFFYFTVWYKYFLLSKYYIFDDGDGRNDGKGQNGDGWHDDGDGRHNDGKGQQGDRQHNDGDGRYDDAARRRQRAARRR